VGPLPFSDNIMVDCQQLLVVVNDLRPIVFDRILK